MARHFYSAKWLHRSILNVLVRKGQILSVHLDLSREQPELGPEVNYASRISFNIRPQMDSIEISTIVNFIIS